DEMHGGAYKTWREDWEDAHPTTSLYEALRCGLVHEYQPKVDSAFWIGTNEPLGLGGDKSVLIFKVEPYYRHFCVEVERLHQWLKSLPHPEIPPPLFKGIKFSPPAPQGPTGMSGPSFPTTSRTS